MTGRRLAGAPNRAIAKSVARPQWGLRRTLPQNEFAFDAQQFGDTAALLVASGSRERRVDYREPFGSFVVTAECTVSRGRSFC
jgi:hypothetical protein